MNEAVVVDLDLVWGCKHPLCVEHFKAKWLRVCVMIDPLDLKNEIYES